MAAGQTRLAILQAEDRRAPTPADLAVLRAGSRSGDPQTRRIAIRALGRLERPALIADIVPALRHPLPEVRAEAANAIGQAAQGWKRERTGADARALAAAESALVSRLHVEAEANARSAILETIGRLPYATADEFEHAEHALVEAAAGAATVEDRLGAAKGLDALVRAASKVRPPATSAVTVLRGLAKLSNGENAGGARIRRLALDALIAANAVDDQTLAAVASDPDAQVRREAVLAAAAPTRERSDTAGAVVREALADPSALVRLEAVRASRDCRTSVDAVGDRDVHGALTALDALAACGASPDATLLLERTLDDLSAVGAPRAWHRAAHALVALASAAPDRAAAKLPPFAVSRTWQLRMYAARAAAVLKDRPTLEKLAANDADDNVREASIDGLSRIAGHEADDVYVANLSRQGYQAVRAAALALVGSSNAAAASALKSALRHLVEEGRDNSHDARDAIEKALGRSDPLIRPKSRSRPSDLSAEELRRLAAPRARIAIRGAGTLELALFTSVAPLTVLRFVHLAEAGYYNGLTFHRVVPNFVVQGGSPGANEYVGDASFIRDEVGLWPHVRGAVGISTRGRDTGDAQIFIDLVDNPRLDHTYTVFAQVLNGMDAVDRILEGDVIDRVEIVP